MQSASFSLSGNRRVLGFGEGEPGHFTPRLTCVVVVVAGPYQILDAIGDDVFSVARRVTCVFFFGQGSVT